MKVSQSPLGSLIKWVDYTDPHRPPVEYLGVLLCQQNNQGLITVLVNGRTTKWYSFQCEVVA
jgi:hypothetical protein